MPIQSDLQIFLDRITSLREKLLAKGEDFSKIPGFKSTVHSNTLLPILDQILNGSLNERLQSLEPWKEPLKVTKPNSKNILSFRILREANGAYKLVIEVKHNRIDLSKRKMEFESGADKTRKVALVYPEEAPLYAEMICPYADEQERKLFMQEVRIQNDLSKKNGIAPLIYAGERVNAEGEKALIFLAPFKPTLSALLDEHYRPQGFDLDNKDQRQKLMGDLIMQLLEVVELLHGDIVLQGRTYAGVEHKDLKPENFLLSLDEESGPELQLTDFKFITKFGDEDPIIGTLSYMPPWLVRSILSKVQLDERVIVDCDGEKIAAIEAILEQSKEDHKILDSYAWHVIKKAVGDGVLDIPDEQPVNGKHDIWSVGCMIARMIYGIELNDIEGMERIVAQDPLLQAIFQYDQDNIPSIAEVKELYKQSAYYQDSLNLQPVVLRAPLEQHDANHWLAGPIDFVDKLLQADVTKEIKKNRSDFCDNFKQTPFKDLKLDIKARSNLGFSKAMLQAINGKLKYSTLEKDLKLITAQREKFMQGLDVYARSTTDEEWGKFKQNELLFKMAEYIIIRQMLKLENSQRSSPRSSPIIFSSPIKQEPISKERVRDLYIQAQALEKDLTKYGPAVQEALEGRFEDEYEMKFRPKL